MNPADLPPKPLPSGEMRYSPSGPVSPAHPRRSEIAPCQSRDGTLPSAVPAPFSSVLSSGGVDSARQEVVASLRASIRRIERGSARSPFAQRERNGAWQHKSASPHEAAGVSALCNGSGDAAGRQSRWCQSHWCLGVPEVDCWIGDLDQAGVHEIKPAVPGPGVPSAMGMAAAFIFALRLAARRVSSEDRHRTRVAERGVILLCTPPRDRLELGRFYGPGVSALGLDPRQFLIVETTKAADTLWAMEEGLRSQVPAIVIGCLDELPLTPARRLSLAAGQYLTPCIVVTGARTPAAGAMATRWRIGAGSSAANSLDQKSPGAGSCIAMLERCRHRVAASGREALKLDWCDETFRFRLAPQMADREVEARKASVGAL